MAGQKGRGKKGNGWTSKRRREESSAEDNSTHTTSRQSSKDEDFVSSPTISRYPRRSSRAVVAKPATLFSPVRNITMRTTRQSSRRKPNKEPTLSQNRENVKAHELKHCTSKQPAEADLISNSQAASSRCPSPEKNPGDSLPIRNDNNAKTNVNKFITAGSLSNWSAPIVDNFILDDQVAPVPDIVATTNQNNYVDIQGTTNFAPHSRCLGRTNSNMSINVTEFAKRLRDEIDDEIESAPDSGLEDVWGHKVLPEFAPLLRRVFDKHGDIASQTVIESPNILSNYLQQLCRVCEHLERTKFVHIKRAELDSMLADVHDFERAKLNVGWLQKKVEYIAQTWTNYHRYYDLKEELEKRDGSIRSLENKLDAYKSQLCDVQRRIVDVEGELEAKRAEAGPIRNVILDTKAKVKDLAVRSLVDGLY